MAMDGYMFDYRLGYVRSGCAMPGFDTIGRGGAPHRLVTLGGYTTPEMARTGRSWVHALSRRAGEKVHMLNGCTDGYSSAQILTLFLREVILFKPERVLCLSGFYNIAYRLGFVQSRSDAALLRTHPFATPKQICFLHGITTKFGLDNDEVFYGEENLLPAWELWLRQMAELRCLCAEFGLEFTSFLQPCVFSGEYRRGEEENAFLRGQYGLADEELEAFHAGFQREYARIAACAKELEYIRDLSGLFDGCENVYADACHVRDEFLPNLAEGML
jgi:hypothetical protein